MIIVNLGSMNMGLIAKPLTLYMNPETAGQTYGIETIQALNPKADIVLVGMYDLLGDAYLYEPTSGNITSFDIRAEATNGQTYYFTYNNGTVTQVG